MLWRLSLRFSIYVRLVLLGYHVLATLSVGLSALPSGLQCFFMLLVVTSAYYHLVYRARWMPRYLYVHQDLWYLTRDPATTVPSEASEYSLRCPYWVTPYVVILPFFNARKPLGKRQVTLILTCREFNREDWHQLILRLYHLSDLSR